MGVQSSHPAELKLLGRNHTQTTTDKTIATLKGAGFSNLNFDFIFGLPGSTKKSVEDSLIHLLKHNPKHVSTYALTIEQGTPFARNQQKKATPELELEQYKRIRNLLQERNFKQYEVSNFAKESYQSSHNKNYWEFGPFIGIGPSATSFFKNRRYTNPRSLSAYNKNPVNKIVKTGTFAPTPRSILRKDYILFALRMLKGLDIHHYNQSFNANFTKSHKASIEMLSNQGLVKLSKERLKVTNKGLFLLDAVTTEFF